MLNKTLFNLQFIPLPFYQSTYKLIQKAVKPLSDYQGKDFCTKLLPNRLSIVIEVHVYKQSLTDHHSTEYKHHPFKKKTGTVTRRKPLYYNFLPCFYLAGIEAC